MENIRRNRKSRGGVTQCHNCAASKFHPRTIHPYWPSVLLLMTLNGLLLHGDRAWSLCGIWKWWCVWYSRLHHQQYCILYQAWSLECFDLWKSIHHVSEIHPSCSMDPEKADEERDKGCWLQSAPTDHLERWPCSSGLAFGHNHVRGYGLEPIKQTDILLANRNRERPCRWVPLFSEALEVGLRCHGSVAKSSLGKHSKDPKRPQLLALVPAAPPPIQLPACGLGKQWRTVQSLGTVLLSGRPWRSSWLWSSSVLAIEFICGVNLWMEDLSVVSFSL